MSEGNRAPTDVLTPSGAVVVTRDGQVVEDLNITADAHGVDIRTFHNVVIRNCKITHNIAKAGGYGVKVNSVNSGVIIEDCEIINLGAPSRGVNPVEGGSNILLEYAQHPIVRRCTLRRGSAGIYLSESVDAELSYLEGHDMRGPTPRGQFVQFSKCTGTNKLDNWSYEDIPGTSHTEDIVNVFNSKGTLISNGKIPYAGDSQTGVGVMVEGSQTGSEGTRVHNVEIGYAWNGFFSAWESNDVWFTNMRIAHMLPGSIRGAASSNKLCICAAGHGLTGTKIHAHYHEVNEANFIWEASNIGDLVTTPGAWPETCPLIRNAFPWRKTKRRVPVIQLDPRINTDGAANVGDTVYILIGRYRHDPTSRVWQWYRNGEVISGANAMHYVVRPADLGQTLTVGETPANAAGAGSEALSAGVSVV